MQPHMNITDVYHDIALRVGAVRRCIRRLGLDYHDYLAGVVSVPLHTIEQVLLLAAGRSLTSHRRPGSAPTARLCTLALHGHTGCTYLHSSALWARVHVQPKILDAETA